MNASQNKAAKFYVAAINQSIHPSINPSIPTFVFPLLFLNTVLLYRDIFCSYIVLFRQKNNKKIVICINFLFTPHRFFSNKKIIQKNATCKLCENKKIELCVTSGKLYLCYMLYILASAQYTGLEGRLSDRLRAVYSGKHAEYTSVLNLEGRVACRLHTPPLKRSSWAWNVCHEKDTSQFNTHINID